LGFCGFSGFFGFSGARGLANLREELEIFARRRPPGELHNLPAQHASKLPTIEILKPPHSSHAPARGIGNAARFLEETRESEKKVRRSRTPRTR